MKSVFKKTWAYIEGINGLVLVVYMVFVYFTAAVINESSSVKYWIVSILISGIAAVIVCPPIIRCLSKVSISNGEIVSQRKIMNPAAANICFFCISLSVFLIYYICSYPGSFSPDSQNQYTQAISNQYNDWHPVMHTLIAFKLPLLLTGGWKGSIVLFQILCFSAVIAYALSVILKYTNLKVAVFSMCYIFLNPQTGCIAMYPWKDVAFAIGTLLLLTYALRIVVTKGIWLKNTVNMVLFILVAVLTTLFRHNAVLFTVPLILAVLFHVTPKRGLILCLGFVLLYTAVKVPLYGALNVESPDKRQIETLGLPMTIIGAAVVSEPEQLDDEIVDFAYKVAPVEVWEEKYSFRTYNNVKSDQRTDNDVIEEYGAVKVLSMMVRSCMAVPSATLKSLVRLTNTIYSISDTSVEFYMSVVNSNRHGVAVRLASWLTEYCRFVSNNFYFLFHLGFAHLALVVSALSKCRLDCLRDWKKLLFVVPLFAYNYGTTLLLTGAEDAVRFFYYTSLILPILLVFIFRKETERTMNDNV